MIEWVIEPSTFCNLRCAYCYEWTGLDDRRRMPLELWSKVLRAACEHHLREERRLGERFETRIIWHGGEPLALPPDYLRRTLELKREIVTESGIEPDRVTTAMQSNLYALSDEAIAILREFDVGLGVSFDLVRGTRVSVTGKTTEARVIRNLDRLREAGITCGAITVLAKHTCPLICDVFDFWAARGFSFRVLPLFAGPAERDAARFAVDDDELVAALCRLFVHWMRTRAPISVKPLDEWLANVVRHLLQLRTRPYDRRRFGESVFVVRPSGDLYQVAELGDESCVLGNLDRQTLDEVLDSSPYLASLDRSAALTARHCSDCHYHGACDGYPAHSAPAERRSRRCPLAYRVQTFMESHLRRAGLRADELVALADDLRLDATMQARHV
jgi:uncharacterized protein